MTMNPLDETATRLSERYSATPSGANAGSLSWPAIVQMLMGIFGGCAPPVALRFATRHPVVAKELISEHYPEAAKQAAVGGRLNVHDATEASYHVFIESSPDQIAAAQAAYKALPAA